MKAKHSPGPWVVNPHYGKENVYYLWREDSNYHEDTSPEVMDANARLISASPELFELAKVLDNWFKDAGYNSNGPSGCSLLFADDITLGTHVRELVAKVKGTRP